MSICMDINAELMYLRVDMKSRSYEMRLRQEAKSATRDAILRAAIETFMAEKSLAFTLGAVADRAGVTVKTVLRHFGSRDGLIDACWQQVHTEVLAERTSPPGDRTAALGVLIAHYELRGNVVLSLLVQEDNEPRAQMICASGRLEHRAWVEEVFSAELPSQPAERSRLIDALVVATDVYSWKLLRVDRRLPIEDVRDRMLLMTGAILAFVASSDGTVDSERP
jgi:AcrR family transcriptional regulator